MSHSLHADLCALLQLDPALATADDVLRLVGECVDRATEAEGRPSDRDPRHDPREGDELLDCAGRRLLVDLVADEYVYVRVTDGAGGLLSAVRVARGRWQAACLGFEPAPP